MSNMEPLPPAAALDETSVLIMGHRVAFPAGKSPFPAQLAVMSSTLAALKRKQHALVESPTGSGKTLALLSSCLTFQRDFMRDAIAEYREKEVQRLQKLQQLRERARAQQQQQQQETPSQFSQFSATSDWDDDAFGLLQRSVKRFKREEATAPVVNAPGSAQVNILDVKTQMITPEGGVREEQETETQRVKPEDGVKQEDNEAVFGPNDLLKDEPPKIPKIFFCSRTHSQLAQAVKELKGCPDSYMQSPECPDAAPGLTLLKSCVLGSKRLLCANEEVNDEPALVNERCQELRMEKERRRMAGDTEEEGGCPYSQTSFSRMRFAAPQIWDIEDVTKLAPSCEECAYFFAKSELETAHIIFCPYNYILDPSIRKAVGISLNNAIVVLDEAHNVEDICREGASFEITDYMLTSAIKSFEEVAWDENDPPRTGAYDAVRNMLSCVESWFEINAELVRDPKDIDDDDCNLLWSTEDALDMLRSCKLQEVTNIDIDEIIQLEQAKLASPGRKVMLSNRALNTASKLISVATYMFSDNAKNADDFNLLITKKMRLNENDEEVVDTKFCVWCMSAAVVFAEVARGSHSVILASGTLSPMDSFAGELGVDFPIRLEANHVVNMRKQVFIGALMTGPGNVDLISTYKNQQNFQYQDSMGFLLLQYAQVIPGGILMFFPSYGLMGMLVARWKRTGVWARFEKHKEMFSEPRQGGKDFDNLLLKYKRTIAEHASAHDTPSGSTSEETEPKQTGAIFLAVYRGKVSEGIDFSDDNARAVLAVGIPFPNFKDLKVSLKREYQDKKSRDNRRLVNGSWWYKLQAFRALNQALGRCIRHRRDYGAVILIDSRHRGNMHGNSLSKWMRPHVQEFQFSEDCNPLFAEFFQRNQIEMPAPPPVPEPEPAPVPTTRVSFLRGPMVLEYEEDPQMKTEAQTVP